MRLDTIEVTGFKSIRGLKLKLRRLNVLIGANGAGKSNFIALFRLLNEMIEQRFQLFVRQQGGADTFLHFSQKNTDKITIYSPFALSLFNILNFKLLVKISPQSQPLQDGFLYA
jgi:predicted ATPase